MKGELRALAILGACLGACGESSDGGADPIEPPPEEAIFREVEAPATFDAQGNVLTTETLLFFDDALFHDLCIVPDADSFDDYEETDSATGAVIVPRGTTPVSEECEADGIVTGPMHDELYPSKWCRIEGCFTADQIGEEPTEGGY